MEMAHLVRCHYAGYLPEGGFDSMEKLQLDI